MKEQHRYPKEIADIEFTFSDWGSYGKVFYVKRDQLVLKAGAKLTKDPELKKDGTPNYSAMVAEKLRQDYADKIKDYVTTEDIVFPSPNLLGLFMRFGGENTWLSLKDKDGKTLNEYCKVPEKE